MEAIIHAAPVRAATVVKAPAAPLELPAPRVAAQEPSPVAQPAAEPAAPRVTPDKSSSAAPQLPIPFSLEPDPAAPEVKPAAASPAAAPPASAEPAPKKGERAETKAQLAESRPTLPAIAVAVPQPIEIRPVPERMSDTAPAPATAKAITPASSGDNTPAPSERPPAVEVKVHFDDPAAPDERPLPAPQIPSAAIPALAPAIVEPAQPRAAANADIANPIAVTSAPSSVQPAAARTIPNGPAAAPAHLAEPPLPETPKPGPSLRSVALEFTPDGAQDVRLRLTEHAGDVHISLHAADPSLAGRLSAGVHDLVGALSQAGYDAQAWTPDQERGHQRQPGEQSEPRRGPQDGATDFSAFIDESKKENA